MPATAAYTCGMHVYTCVCHSRLTASAVQSLRSLPSCAVDFGRGVAVTRDLSAGSGDARAPCSAGGSLIREQQYPGLGPAPVDAGAAGRGAGPADEPPCVPSQLEESSLQLGGLEERVRMAAGRQRRAGRTDEVRSRRRPAEGAREPSAALTAAAAPTVPARTASTASPTVAPELVDRLWMGLGPEACEAARPAVPAPRQQRARGVLRWLKQAADSLFVRPREEAAVRDGAALAMMRC